MNKIVLLVDEETQSRQTEFSTFNATLSLTFAAKGQLHTKNQIIRVLQDPTHREKIYKL